MGPIGELQEHAVLVELKIKHVEATGRGGQRAVEIVRVLVNGIDRRVHFAAGG